MFVPIFLAFCFASSTVLAAYDKTYYDIEDAESLFDDYVKEHKKVYDRKEYYERLEIFKESLKDINERNQMFPNTVFAVDSFADLKPHELQKYHGLKISNETIRKEKIPLGRIPAPEEFDWRKKNVVSHVKNQGHCGSCFIFSAIGNIEGQYAIKYKQSLALSEGQALDCLRCGQCDGGFAAEVMGELSRTVLMKEADYTYEPIKQYCHENSTKGVVRVSGKVTYLDTPDEDTLKNYLVNIGPLAISVNANDFLFYKKGIVEPNKCSNQPLNHGMLLVGYGIENNQEFWIIKNSWGLQKGDKGYVNLRRGVKACGIGEYTVTSTVI